MFNASTVMHHNVYVFYMSLLLFTFVNLRSLIKLESHDAAQFEYRFFYGNNCDKGSNYFPAKFLVFIMITQPKSSENCHFYRRS